MTKNVDYDYEKLTKEQKECLSLVESLGIYELRALARVFGGNAPTTLKRNDHIHIVMDKIISGEELRPLPLKQGRPYKELSNLNGILQQLSQITGKNYSVTAGQNVQTKKNITFRQIEQDVFAQKLFPIKAKGFLLQNNKDEYFFFNQYNGKYVLVDKKVFNKIDQFDFVEGTAVVMNSEKEYYLTELKSINFQSYDKYKGKGVSASANSFSFDGSTLPLGKKYKFENVSKLVDEAEKLSTLVKELHKTKVSTLAIVPNVAEDEVMSLQLVGFDNLIYSTVSDTAEDLYQNLAFAIDYVRHQQELGGSVAVFVQDYVTLTNMVDYCFSANAKIFMNHTNNVAELVKELGSIALSKANQTVTFFTTFDNSDLFDPLYVSFVYKNYKSIK